MFGAIFYIFCSFRTPDAVMVRRLIMDNANVSNFERFQFLLRLEFNDLVHCVIDGTMCTPDSASAPEFFLHHGFVDKIWWDWQRQGSSRMFNEYFVSQTQHMPTTMYRSYDFLDLNNQPECVCGEWKHVYKLKQMYFKPSMSGYSLTIVIIINLNLLR